MDLKGDVWSTKENEGWGDATGIHARDNFIMAVPLLMPALGRPVVENVGLREEVGSRRRKLFVKTNVQRLFRLCFWQVGDHGLH